MKYLLLIVGLLFSLQPHLLAQNYNVEFQSPAGYEIPSPYFMPDIANFDRSGGWDFEGDDVPDVVVRSTEPPVTIYVYDGADYTVKWEFVADGVVLQYFYFLGFYDIDADGSREALLFDLISGVHFIDYATKAIEFSIGNAAKQPKAVMDYDNDGNPELLVEDLNFQLFELWGSESGAGIGSDPGSGAVPRGSGLSQNYPNPFNPETTIRYSIKEAGSVMIEIYNLHGQRVRTLVNGEKPVGEYSIAWDGKNDRGVHVASGTYLYQLETGGSYTTRKMVILK